MLEAYNKRILKTNLYDVVKETPLQKAEKLSQRYGNHILLKREDLQPVHSFKIRGAYNKLKQLSEQEKQSGVIAASAGNHAQGVALSAQKLGIKAYIVMPKTSPPIKVDAVRRYGAKVFLHGDNFDEAYEFATETAEKQGHIFIHPFDDPDIIAGQATVGQEIMQYLGKDCDAIFIPVGGGGLLAGVAAYVKYIYPKVKIIGVEPENAASMTKALAEKKRISLAQVGIFADGVAVKQVGKEPFKIAKETVDNMITVSTDEICAAIKDYFEETRAIIEPAGALSIAGLKKYCKRYHWTDKTLVAIASGANVNFDRLRHISERAEIGEEKEALFAVTIPEKPGSFKAFCTALGKRSITEFNYRYASADQAHIFVGIECGDGPEDRNTLLKQLKSKGFPVLDMTDNEMAKLHIRHMVGGKSQHMTDERLFRFQFPERPGALLDFLSQMGSSWNITLFHYRNHGAAFGRVLVGMQIPENEEKDFKQFTKKLAYVVFDESRNPAYPLFL